MRLDPKRVRAFAEKAETEDLLDRVTIYRADMEPIAVGIFQEELCRRGVSAEQIAAHAQSRRETTLSRSDGGTLRCHFCERPAVVREWHWHRVFGFVPVFPRQFACCTTHRR